MFFNNNYHSYIWSFFIFIMILKYWGCFVQSVFWNAKFGFYSWKAKLVWK